MSEQALKTTQLDTQGYPTLRFRPDNSPTPPTDPVDGQLWRNPSKQMCEWHSDTQEWVSLATDPAMRMFVADEIEPLSSTIQALGPSTDVPDLRVLFENSLL